MKREIIYHLETFCGGRDNALRSVNLASMLGLHPKRERQVRAAIAELIEEGHLIGAAVAPPHGYYLITDPREVERYTAQLWRRIKCMARRARKIDESGARKFTRWTQTEMFG